MTDTGKHVDERQATLATGKQWHVAICAVVGVFAIGCGRASDERQADGDNDLARQVQAVRSGAATTIDCRTPVVTPPSRNCRSLNDWKN